MADTITSILPEILGNPTPGIIPNSRNPFSADIVPTTSPSLLAINPTPTSRRTASVQRTTTLMQTPQSWWTNISTSWTRISTIEDKLTSSRVISPIETATTPTSTLTSSSSSCGTESTIPTQRPQRARLSAGAVGAISVASTLTVVFIAAGIGVWLLHRMRTKRRSKRNKSDVLVDVERCNGTGVAPNVVPYTEQSTVNSEYGTRVKTEVLNLPYVGSESTHFSSRSSFKTLLVSPRASNPPAYSVIGQ
ncbi:hypothetical protein BJ165DRAFT_1511194 [Panaeolus papilionaceus]|nr:hypothetical protein BJ165DRAFT_1511194 [Panaeolus papilionaceus]